MYLFFHFAHLVLLMFFVFFRSGELSSGLAPTVSFWEWLFWLWTTDSCM